MTDFAALPLPAPVLDNLHGLGFHQMTAIQAAAIPPILAGADVVAQAKTGSGKTAAYGIGCLERIDPRADAVQCLVVCPTRELATQVAQALRALAKAYGNLTVLTLTGGRPEHRQAKSLQHPAQVVVGTPGRLLKHLTQGNLHLDALRCLVLDEADRMLDLGFIEPIRALLDFCPATRQTLCFSATLPDAVQALSAQIQRDPTAVRVDTHHQAAIEHHFLSVTEDDKPLATLALLARERPASTLIFCNTKAQVRALCAELNDAGVHASAFHGDLDQRDRSLAVARFANQSCTVLVATDVAARGLDIDSLAAVINYDLPFKADTYVHRAGRTGRAGATGQAFTWVTPAQAPRLAAIEAALQRPCPLETAALHGGEALPDLAPPMITLSISGGRKQKLSAGDILGAITGDGELTGADVGQITRLDHLSFVAVRRAVARAALQRLQARPIKGRRYRAQWHD